MHNVSPTVAPVGKNTGKEEERKIHTAPATQKYENVQIHEIVCV